MPYFITGEGEAEGCSGYAVVKDDGEVIGCHTTKQEAIDQMVAVSIAEDMEPGGEYSQRQLPNNYRPALSEDVPEGRACGNCYFYNDDLIQEDMAFCERWQEYVRGDYYCNAWRPDDLHEEEEEEFADRQDAPAPPSEQIEGSEENEPGSAQGAGGDIELSEATTQALRNKVTEHNDEMAADDKPDWTRTTLGQLSAVYRRGAGAYSNSHRPGMTRGQWAMARVNSFLYLLRNGRPENPAYITDNDLLPEDHPRSTRKKDDEDPYLEMRSVTVPQYIRDAAARGLELRRQGFGGDGLTDQTIREARLMADGEMSDDKVIRANAWGARHEVDLDAPQNSDSDNEDWPGAGAVAHYLWGIDPLDPMPARNWLEREAARIRSERMIMSNVEIRTFDAAICEVRSEGDGMTFGGYAWRYNEPSLPLPFTERIAPGAFRRTLKSKNDIRAYVNHDDTRLLGSTRAKTLRIEDRPEGGYVEIDLPDTSDGRDIRTLVARGDITGMSFGFSTVKDSWSNDGGERTLLEVRLHEVSVVTAVPAYPSTTASVRNLRVIAKRTDTDAAQLAEAISALEAGDLTDDQAAILRKVVDNAAGVQEPDPAIPVALLMKQLDLLGKAI